MRVERMLLLVEHILLSYTERRRPIGIVLIVLVGEFDKLPLRFMILSADYGNFAQLVHRFINAVSYFEDRSLTVKRQVAALIATQGTVNPGGSQDQDARQDSARQYVHRVMIAQVNCSKNDPQSVSEHYAKQGRRDGARSPPGE